MIWRYALRYANLASIAVLVWLHVKGFENHEPAEVLSDGRVEFPPNRLRFATWLIAVAIPAWAALDALLHRSNKPMDVWSWVVIVLIALAELLSFPGTVVVTREDIEQVYWFQKIRRIRWSDIVEINIGDKIRTVTITGADGTKIVHSGQLPDRPRLLEEIKRYCGPELPPDFPQETASSIPTSWV